MLKTWDKKAVLNLIKDKFSDYKFIVASNRQPYIHRLLRGKIQSTRGPGGVITALDPIMKELKGSWVCCGSGNADRLVAKDSKVRVPPNNPVYDLRYVWLTKEENLGYYFGFSNQALWPLSHLVFMQPSFSNEHWEVYKQVNKKFAQNISKEINGKKDIDASDSNNNPDTRHERTFPFYQNLSQRFHLSSNHSST